MNDRFKFRVWDERKKQYADRYVIGDDGWAYQLHDAGEDSYDLIPDEDVVIEQCTGLTDKNGKLIYEGDVVRVEDDYGVCNSDEHIDTGIGAVEWECEMWYIDGDVNNGLYDIDCTRYIEVIGNIHEMEVEK